MHLLIRFTDTATVYFNCSILFWFTDKTNSYRYIRFWIVTVMNCRINPLKAELNPIRHLLALVGAHHIVHVSRVRVKNDDTVGRDVF